MDYPRDRLRWSLGGNKKNRKKMMYIMKKDNYIFIIGLIIGVLLSATGVYAVTQYTSNNIYYVNKNSTLSSNNV